jgi:ubiquinone/menaquinone biosynthesis C-methylase UbiE
MATDNPVERHYGRAGIAAAIRAGFAALGKAPETATIDDLSAVDEFHIGGRQATAEVLGQLGLAGHHRVLDIGSGIGGAARFAAQTYGCRVDGIDLTAEYVETAAELSRWVGLGDRVSFRQASALDLPFDAATFDGAFMLHVGMNIADKQRRFAEVARVVKPEATVGIYDVMATADEEIDFPVPWASVRSLSAVDTPETYKALLRAAGFAVVAERNRRDFALAFFEALRARMAGAGGPPPLGLHIVMGPDAATKIGNMIANIQAGRIAPVEIVACRMA